MFKRFSITRCILLLLLLCVLAPGIPRAQEPEVTERRYNAEGEPVAELYFLKETPISIVLDEIKTATGYTVMGRGKVPQMEVKVGGEALTVEQALEKIAGPNNLKWIKTEEGYELWDKESYQQEVLPTLTEQKIFVPVHIDADYFQEAVRKANILTPDVGSISFDPRTNQVIVVDLPEVLVRVQDLLNLLDVSLYTRVFYIKYANVSEIAEKIEQYKSEPGSIDVDEKAHLIIVEDVLPNIHRMAALIDLLDTRRPRVVYNLNSIDIEETELDDLEANLDGLLTEEAYYYIDAKRGLLIVEDIPEVHDDVRKFLQVFNRTVDQVLIQAELLDVSQSFGLNYGTDWVYNQVLPSDVLNQENTDDATMYEFDNLGTALSRRLSWGGEGATLNYAVPVGDGMLSMQLQAALSRNDTQVLLRPRLLIKNGGQATIKSTTDNPILNQSGYRNYSGDVDNSGSRYSFSQSSVESGLIVDLEPKISPTGLIEVQISIENSSANEKTLQAEGQDYTAYEKNQDQIDTILIIPDGATRVISGITRKSNSESRGGVPILVNIPWIGPLLFGNKSNSDDRRELLFFITPTIVREEPTGGLIAFEFDELESETWTDAENAMSLRQEAADSAMDIDAMLEEVGWDMPTTATESTTSTLPMRFDAPDPEAPVLDEDEAAGGADGLLPDDSVPNTPEALEQLLEQGGGKMPEMSGGKLLGPGVRDSATPKEGNVYTGGGGGGAPAQAESGGSDRRAGRQRRADQREEAGAQQPSPTPARAVPAPETTPAPRPAATPAAQGRTE